MGLEKHIRPLVPRAIIERFPNSEGVVREEKLSMVDWEETTAIGSGQGLVYVVADDEYERDRILSDLERDLSEVVGLDGNPIAVAIHRREDLYEGDYVHRAPDLIFDQRPGVHTSEAMGGGEVMSAPTNWRGENVPDGMVLFAGEGVTPQTLDPIRIADIAPTVLHWMGLAVPSDMDGSPLTHVFDPESEPGRRPAEVRTPLPDRGESTSPGDLDDDVRDRLVEIGYLE
jgi:predicted AlkP superfamily phosphohydrolase/phosphomutase